MRLFHGPQVPDCHKLSEDEKQERKTKFDMDLAATCTGTLIFKIGTREELTTCTGAYLEWHLGPHWNLDERPADLGYGLAL